MPAARQPASRKSNSDVFIRHQPFGEISCSPTRKSQSASIIWYRDGLPFWFVIRIPSTGLLEPPRSGYKTVSNGSPKTSIRPGFNFPWSQPGISFRVCREFVKLAPKEFASCNFPAISGLHRDSKNSSRFTRLQPPGSSRFPFNRNSRSDYPPKSLHCRCFLTENDFNALAGLLQKI